MRRSTYNIYNIRYVPSNNWQGQVGEYKGFCVFRSEEYAIRAQLILMRTYFRNGYRTIRTIIERFAPRTENATDTYIGFVLMRVQSVAPDWRIDDEMEYLEKEFCLMLTSMAWVESAYVLSVETIVGVAAKYGITKESV